MKQVTCITCGNNLSVPGKLQCTLCARSRDFKLQAVAPKDPLRTIGEFSGSSEPSLVGVGESPVTCLVRHNASGEVVMLENFVLVGFQDNEELTVINVGIVDMQRAVATVTQAYQDMLKQASPEVRRQMTKDMTKDVDMTTTILQDLSERRKDN